jgi:cytosine/uracil/thiamine/allantoin permease
VDGARGFLFLYHGLRAPVVSLQIGAVRGAPRTRGKIMKFAVIGILIYAATQAYGAISAGKALMNTHTEQAAKLERLMNGQ